MPLLAGQRLHGAGRDIYVVDECLQTGPPTALYAGRKVFFNYRFEEDEFYEASPEEWIAVRIRVPDLPDHAGSEAIENARARLEYEATSVLGRIPGWFPEPVDWHHNSAPPLLVMSAAHGLTLGEWRREQTAPNAYSLRIAAELLNMLDAVHRNGQVVGPFGPDDFRVDETARVFFTGTDRVRPSERRVNEELEKDAWKPVPRGCVAPELLGGSNRVDRRTDLYSWAALFSFLISSWDPAGPSGASAAESFREGLTRLSEAVPHTLRAMSPPTDRRPISRVASCWSNAVRRALADNPRERPKSVAAVWGLAIPRNPLSRLASLWRRD